MTESRVIMTAAEYPDFKNQSSSSCTDMKCVFYSVANVITFILGIAGISLVIWIAGFKMKKSVIATWYLSMSPCPTLQCNVLHLALWYRPKDYRRMDLWALRVQIPVFPEASQHVQ
ncbi:hypothetical protein SRHO_G00259950 [Serrasalmus rhombeus]